MIYVGILDCSRLGDDFGFVGIGLDAIDDDKRTFRRPLAWSLEFIPVQEVDNAEVRDIYISRDNHTQVLPERNRTYLLTRRVPPNKSGFHCEGVFTLGQGRDDLVSNRLIELSCAKFGQNEKLMVVICRHGDLSYTIVLKHDFQLNPHSWEGKPSFEDIHRFVLAVVVLPTGDRTFKEMWKVLSDGERLQGDVLEPSESCVGDHFPGTLRASISWERVRGQRLPVMDIDVVE